MCLCVCVYVCMCVCVWCVCGCVCVCVRVFAVCALCLEQRMNCVLMVNWPASYIASQLKMLPIAVSSETAQIFFTAYWKWKQKIISQQFYSRFLSCLNE